MKFVSPDVEFTIDSMVFVQIPGATIPATKHTTSPPVFPFPFPDLAEL